MFTKVLLPHKMYCEVISRKQGFFLRDAVDGQRKKSLIIVP